MGGGGGEMRGGIANIRFPQDTCRDLPGMG